MSYSSLLHSRTTVVIASASVSVSILSSFIENEKIPISAYTSFPFQERVAYCQAPVQTPSKPVNVMESIQPSGPSWFRRSLSVIGVPLPKPRLLTPRDPALKLPKKYIRQREKDEQKMRQLLEKAPQMRSDPEKLKALSEELFEVTYGKGVTAQEREDFLVRYGCSGWTEAVLNVILDIAESRGVVEMGAGHGQWARALSEAYTERQVSSQTPGTQTKKKHFDFVLAYDDNSDLPLNTHVYNPYTKPHHDYFGTVQKLESPDHAEKVLKSWSCRGRVLLLVYPPPGPMALDTVKTFVDAAPGDNDTVIFVGEGRGGANGDERLFDYFEQGDWELMEEMDVKRPPGDKGYEKLFILRHRFAL